MKSVTIADVIALALLFIAPQASHSAEFAAPYVPTAPSVVEQMLKLAKVGPDDFVVDLGSGDGRIVITAARQFGARGFGVDIDQKLVDLANANAIAAGVADRARFYNQDLFTADLTQASVVTMYLLTRFVMKLEEKLLTLKPGTRIVSHAGSMGNWRSDQFLSIDVPDRVRPDAPVKTYMYLWVVPAKVGGRWLWSGIHGDRQEEHELTLTQQYQNIQGVLRTGNGASATATGRMNGDSFVLNFDFRTEGTTLRQQYSGKVTGDSIVGSLDAQGQTLPWQAARAASGADTK